MANQYTLIEALCRRHGRIRAKLQPGQRLTHCGLPHCGARLSDIRELGSGASCQTLPVFEPLERQEDVMRVRGGLGSKVLGMRELTHA